jgi:hypothetical protein
MPIFRHSPSTEKENPTTRVAGLCFIVVVIKLLVQELLYLL